MGILSIFRSSATVYIADCLSRSITEVDALPASLSGKSADGEDAPLCRLLRKRKRFFLEPLDPNCLPLLNGQPIGELTELETETSYGLWLKGHLLVLHIAEEKPDFPASFAEQNWLVWEKAAPSRKKRITDEHLSRSILARAFSPVSRYACAPEGVEINFALSELFELLPDKSHAAKPQKSDFGTDAAARLENNEGHTCPSCWKVFAVGEVMNIAANHSPEGDTLLGPHAKERFHAERFNELGQAIDRNGVVSLDLACPHCRGRLPPSFFSQDHLIISLVGAPSSGKSYYLAVLLKQLPEELIRHHAINLQDGDPSGNTQLNEMKNRLFSATTREDAFISKTDFEGLMYDRLMRNGNLVPLPRPFVFHLQANEDAAKRAALVFYDNAGEHFKPTVDTDDAPGALHVAASSTLFFLFDPATNRAFRKELQGKKRDVQLKSATTDEQDTLLAEMGARIKKIKALESHERVDTPLAILAGKLDLWRSLLPENALREGDNEALSEEDVAHNSRITRELLLTLCPTIVNNAESISTCVTYFPISSLGHSPKEIAEGPLAGKLAPNPRLLNPVLATAPAIWALSKTLPDTLRLDARATEQA